MLKQYIHQHYLCKSKEQNAHNNLLILLNFVLIFQNLSLIPGRFSHLIYFYHLHYKLSSIYTFLLPSLNGNVLGSYPKWILQEDFLEP